MNKTFAPEYNLNELGWYEFPADANYRKMLFPERVMKHPARANLYMLQAIIEYVSEPEQLIADIMAGSGSIMVAALIGRRVLMIEIIPDYCKLISEGIETLEVIAPGIGTQITLIPGDANKILPIPAIDHIIFSPPYAQIMRMSKPTGIQKELYGDEGALYQDIEGNVGRLSKFIYNQTMEKIYKKCFASLSPGGTMTVIIKDYIENQKRVYLSDWIIRRCSLMGFKLKDWFKWQAPGTFFHTMRKARGENVVNEEEIIILERPA